MKLAVAGTSTVLGPSTVELLRKGRLRGAACGIAVVWARAAEILEGGALGGVAVAAPGVAVWQAGGQARRVAGEGLHGLREREGDCMWSAPETTVPCFHNWGVACPLNVAGSTGSPPGNPAGAAHLRHGVRDRAPSCGSANVRCCKKRQ